MWLRSTANSSQTDKKKLCKLNSFQASTDTYSAILVCKVRRWTRGRRRGVGWWGGRLTSPTFCFCGIFTATAHQSPPLRRSTVVRVIASQWQETRQPKCVALDKRCFFFTHACVQSLADSSNEAEDKWSFSTPLRRFSILSTTSLLLKEKFIWRHKSDLHREAMPRLLSEGTAKDGRLCVALKGFIQQLKQT